MFTPLKKQPWNVNLKLWFFVWEMTSKIYIFYNAKKLEHSVCIGEANRMFTWLQIEIVH